MKKRLFVSILNKQSDQTDIEGAISQLSIYLERKFKINANHSYR